MNGEVYFVLLMQLGSVWSGSFIWQNIKEMEHIESSPVEKLWVDIISYLNKTEHSKFLDITLLRETICTDLENIYAEDYLIYEFSGKFGYIHIKYRKSGWDTRASPPYFESPLKAKKFVEFFAFCKTVDIWEICVGDNLVRTTEIVIAALNKEIQKYGFLEPIKQNEIKPIRYMMLGKDHDAMFVIIYNFPESNKYMWIAYTEEGNYALVSKEKFWDTEEAKRNYHYTFQNDEKNFFVLDFADGGNQDLTDAGRPETPECNDRNLAQSEQLKPFGGSSDLLSEQTNSTWSNEINLAINVEDYENIQKSVNDDNQNGQIQSTSSLMEDSNNISNSNTIEKTDIISQKFDNEEIRKDSDSIPDQTLVSSQSVTSKKKSEKEKKQNIFRRTISNAGDCCASLRHSGEMALLILQSKKPKNKNKNKTKTDKKQK